MYLKDFIVHDLTVLEKCYTEYEAKIQKVLVIKKQNLKLNRQLCVNGSSFMLNVHWLITVCVRFLLGLFSQKMHNFLVVALFLNFK